MKAYLLIPVATLFLLAAPDAHAYIGPGAGFAFLGSSLVFLLTIGMALVTLLFWPVQWAVRKARGLGVSRKARTRRVVIVGYDGLEPSLVEKYMVQGGLPNFSRLAAEGSYERLRTTLPALSPVAWSTFQTGVNPGSHNIFDFLTRDKRTYLPGLSSTETRPPRRVFRLGRWTLPLGRPEVRITRRSRPFWRILGEHGVFSNVLRVPISYPPEKTYGNVLSAMCAPDLKGTQGSFLFVTTRPAREGGRTVGGEVRGAERCGTQVRGEIEGPPLPEGKGYATTPFTLEPRDDGSSATFRCGSAELVLSLNSFSPWFDVEFVVGRKKVSGICRVCLRELTPDVSLYVSPVNVHPERPILPIASPLGFANWLSKRVGPFGTLGMMEDTWGRNEHALDDRRFLDQAWDTHAERERMFLEVLDRTREGVCIGVFDAPDRLQHMFWRYIDPAHPSPREAEAFDWVIPDLYRRLDTLLGKVLARVRPGDVLLVLSDHGFTSFRRGVNLNTWLLEEGYLAVKGGASTGADYLQDVDWSRTRAFALGLSGIYLNVQGREQNGVVAKAEVGALKAEIAAKLERLIDPKGGEPAIHKVYDSATAYRGLYTEEAPDLIMGYRPGYRVSWDSITGTIEPAVFSDNVKAWSGDHHVDPELIPGVLFTNRPLKVKNPHIADLAPTTLDLFAVRVPQYMEGQVIL